MRRREVIAGLSGAVAWPGGVWAQPAEKVHRLGALLPAAQVARSFRQATIPELAKLGFVEGRPGSSARARRRSPAFGRREQGARQLQHYDHPGCDVRREGLGAPRRRNPSCPRRRDCRQHHRVGPCRGCWFTLSGGQDPSSRSRVLLLDFAISATTLAAIPAEATLLDRLNAANVALKTAKVRCALASPYR